MAIMAHKLRMALRQSVDSDAPEALLSAIEQVEALAAVEPNLSQAAQQQLTELLSYLGQWASGSDETTSSEAFKLIEKIW